MILRLCRNLLLLALVTPVAGAFAAGADEEEPTRAARAELSASYGYTPGMSGEHLDKLERDVLKKTTIPGQFTWVQLLWPLGGRGLYASLGYTDVRGSVTLPYGGTGLAAKIDCAFLDLGLGFALPLGNPAFAALMGASLAGGGETITLKSGAGSQTISSTDELGGYARLGLRYAVVDHVAVETWLHTGSGLGYGLSLGGSYAF